MIRSKIYQDPASSSLKSMAKKNKKTQENLYEAPRIIRSWRLTVRAGSPGGIFPDPPPPP